MLANLNENMKFSGGPKDFRYRRMVMKYIDKQKTQQVSFASQAGQINRRTTTNASLGPASPIKKISSNT